MHSDRLAFKAYEIEELADVYFFRPVGMIFALGARALRLTPTMVTMVSVAIGFAGGLMLSVEDLARTGFGLIILYGVLDSSDGQLARMTGQSSELGRLVDGLGGYIVYVAIYLSVVSIAIAAGRWPGWAIVVMFAGAVVSNVVHAQMYDYHRTAYAQVVLKGEPFSDSLPRLKVPWAAALLRTYGAVQRSAVGSHAEVERAVTARAVNGQVDPGDRERYRRHFYRPVRGWNVLGDNTRFYAIGILVWLERLDWFLLFLLIPMNVALAWLWVWQARADRRFLAGR